ncbi:MAG: class I SAM-dependent methyltransferase [Verrucomicrobiota bacterium]
MAYEEIDYEAQSPKVPEPFAALIAEADARWSKFWDQQLNKRYPRYVASEPAQVYAALKYVREEDLALGDCLVEWGSGFGVATCLAAQLGYEATGIELEEGLVDIARELAASHQIAAEFIATSYIPEGYISFETIGGSDVTIDDSFGHSLGHTPLYDEMETPINEIDVFFVYPWPGEQEMMLKLFDALAGEGAILIAYYGDRDICLYRKLDE